MTSEEAEIVRKALADNIRALADLADVLTAVAAALRLCVDALERLEQDLITISSVIDGL